MDSNLIKYALAVIAGLVIGFFGHDVVNQPHTSPLMGGSGIALRSLENANQPEKFATSDGKITITVLRRDFTVEKSEKYSESKAKPAGIPEALDKFATAREAEGFTLETGSTYPEKKGKTAGCFSMYRPAGKDGSPAMKLVCTFKS